MSRISVSALHYMTRMANFHCKFSLAFNTLPNEVNDENYGKIMRCALFEILYLTEVYLVTD